MSLIDEITDEDGNLVLDKGRERSIYSAVCCRCAHLVNPLRHRCNAFPDRIPDEIWNGDNDHTQAGDGDNGIRFQERVPGKVNKKFRKLPTP